MRDNVVTGVGADALRLYWYSYAGDDTVAVRDNVFVGASNRGADLQVTCEADTLDLEVSGNTMVEAYNTIRMSISASAPVFISIFSPPSNE